MKISYYDYANRLKNYSSVLYCWAVDNNLGLFDFDHCMYDSDRYSKIQGHFTELAKNHSVIIIVEQHPFFDSDERYIETKNEVLMIANQLNLALYFLTADYRYWDNISTNECFYPHWYFELRAYAIGHNYKNFNWSSTKKYNFSCNNMSNYRSEKIYNYIECYRRNRPDWWLSIYNHPHTEISKIDINDIGNIKEDQMVIWNEQIKDTIKFYEYDLYKNEPQCAMSTLFPGHVDAACNLVMEHSMEIEILSEKSFKPFVARQIPVYLAHAGACEMLTKLGFDLFYDFIDHDQYDKIGQGFVDRFPESWIDRIDQVHKLLDQLYTTNFIDFINDINTEQRLEKNCDYFYSDTIDQLCLDKFKQLVK